MYIYNYHKILIAKLLEEYLLFLQLPFIFVALFKYASLLSLSLCFVKSR